MIDRQSMVSQSVVDYAKAALAVRGYDAGTAYIMDEDFPDHEHEVFDQNVISIGFDFDDDGEPAETGSSLTTRTYTLEFYVFGTTRAAARNIAAVLKFALEVEGTIPLKDYEQAGDPEIDRMVVIGASTERQRVERPEPWQEHIYLTTVRVEDVYYAALV